MAPDGTATVVYMGRNGPGVDVLARQFDPRGSPIGPVFAVNEYAAGGQILWGADSDSNGNFAVAWEQGVDAEGRQSEIYARVFLADGTLDAVFTDTEPAIALADRGEVAVAWESWWAEGDAHYGVRGVRFELGCFEDETSVCLGGRFHVRASYRTTTGESGAAHAAASAGDTALFWFFSPANVELAVKVLDGCPVNDRYWVYATGLTDVEVELEITDSWTGRVWARTNPLRTPFPPMQDVGALATCGAQPFGARTLGSEPPEGRALPRTRPSPIEADLFECAADATHLCLGSGRFRAAASYATAQGASGEANAVPFSDESGIFWFFWPENLELLVKVLDACVPFERFWVFAGGLTDVQVRLEVEDLATGAVRSYDNPLGVPFQPVQDAAAFATCP
jgi:hypothetical protein